MKVKFMETDDQVFIFFTVETNVLMEIGDRQDWIVNNFGKPTELAISNKACISEYALNSDKGTYFEISFFPENVLQTMRDAEKRIKEKHGEDLIFPIRHRKMGTTFTIFLTKDKSEWNEISGNGEIKIHIKKYLTE